MKKGVVINQLFTKKSYNCNDIFCADKNQKTGWNFCGMTSKTSVMDELGLGVTLYFKFIKYLIWMFVLFSILSIPSFIFSTTCN